MVLVQVLLNIFSVIYLLKGAEAQPQELPEIRKSSGAAAELSDSGYLFVTRDPTVSVHVMTMFYTMKHFVRTIVFKDL